MERRVLKARLAAVGLAALAVAAVLAASWYAFWTFLDPEVAVPDPVVVRAANRTGDAASVLFLGDFAPTDKASRLIVKKGFGYPFDGTRSLVAAHDLAVANLESPITASDRPFPVPKKYVYKIDPAAAPEIRRAGVDVATLANNHVGDYGAQGLADTLRHLDEAGIAHVGADMTEAGARRGAVLDTAGGRLGVLAYMEDKLDWRLFALAFALDLPFARFSGAARFGDRDLAADIDRLKKACDAVVIVLHFGLNYAPVTPEQERLARRAVELGADAVIGHHPHWFQPIEMYRDRPVVYSLGNWAFGTQGNAAMRFGMGVAAHLRGGRLVALEIVPLETQNRTVRFRPRVPKGKALEAFFDGLLDSSARRNARIERRGDRGWLLLGPSTEGKGHS